MAQHLVCLYDFTWDELTRLFAHRDVSLALLGCSEEPERRRAELARADVVIASLHRTNPLRSDDVAVMERCRVVQAAAAGFDSIDDLAAATRGIPVANLPGFNVDAVADWTVGALLWLLRRYDMADASVRSCGWDGYLGQDVAALTIGIAGFGRIGRALAARVEAFGAAVLGFDEEPIPKPYPQVSLEELFERSDAVVLHLPLNAGTRSMIDGPLLERMRPGSLLINAGRGGVVDEGALVAALQSGRLGGAALDVFSEEPLPADSPVRQRSDVLLSPHCAGDTRAAEKSMRRDLVAAVDHVLDGGAPWHVVNGVPERVASGDTRWPW